MGAIKLESLMDVRDFALFSVLAYSWARVSAVAALNVEDYYERKGTRWLRFQEKRGKIHEVPVHSKAREAVDRWIAASALGSELSGQVRHRLGVRGHSSRHVLECYYTLEQGVSLEPMIFSKRSCGRSVYGK